MYIDHVPEIYKVDISILITLLSSFVPNNTSSFFLTELSALNCNYHKISYSLVVILELNSSSEVQYKGIMMIGDE